MLCVFVVGCGQEDSTQDSSQNKADTDKWPARGISMIVPFKAGGDTDYYARLYAQYLEKELGVTVTVSILRVLADRSVRRVLLLQDPDGLYNLFYHTGKSVCQLR